MDTNEQVEDTFPNAGDESPLQKSIKEQKSVVRENSEERQLQKDTPATKEKEDEELEEGELIDDDDDDDDDDEGDHEDNKGPPPGSANSRIGPSNTTSNNAGSDNAGQGNVGAARAGSGHARGHNFDPSNVGPGGTGPVQKLNIRCRFYSKTINKCTWGDQCRFEHRDDSPDPNEPFDHHGPPGPPHQTMPLRRPAGPTLPPMGPAERPYPPYANRSQPYPMIPHGYGPYDMYGPPQPIHHQSPPLPPHFMQPHNWRHQQHPQHGILYHPSPPGSAHPPFESSSPSHPSTAGVGPSSHDGSVQPSPGPANASVIPPGGPLPHNYPSASSPASSALYERKHRLAYELAPWNDRASGGYPSNKYDRGDPAVAGGYPPPHSARGSFYRNHYSRDPYVRDHPPEGPPYHAGSGGPPHASYPPNYPPTYPSNFNHRGPMGLHPSHYRYMSSSHRNLPPEGGRSRSNKRGHDEDESSWSDSGSEDSILGQACYNNKSHSSKSNKKPHHQHLQSQQSNHHPSQRQQEASTAALSSDDTNQNDYSLDQGSGTPTGEPLPEDKDDRQAALLNTLKEIEEGWIAQEEDERRQRREQEHEQEHDHEK